MYFYSVHASTFNEVIYFLCSKLGFPFQNITKSSFGESFIKCIDIVDTNILIYIINNGEATPLHSFKQESESGGGRTTKITELWNGHTFSYRYIAHFV